VLVVVKKLFKKAGKSSGSFGGIDFYCDGKSVTSNGHRGNPASAMVADNPGESSELSIFE
jgi:hypothetical protein